MTKINSESIEETTTMIVFLDAPVEPAPASIRADRTSEAPDTSGSF